VTQSFSLRRVLAMARKEWMHIGRDRITLYFALGMPIVLLVVFGYAVSFDLSGIRTVVVDEDRTAESRGLASHLFSGPTFEEVQIPARADDAVAIFRGRDASLVVVVPKGFGRRLAAGDAVHVQALVDATDNVTAGSILSYLARFAAAVNSADPRAARGAPPIDARVRTLYNPELESTVFLVPGLIALIQAMMGVLLTALAVAREWEKGSMEQLLATPLSRQEIVLGKLLPYFGIGLAQLLLILAVGTWLFDVPIRGSLLLLFAMSSLFLLACLAQGLFISVVTRNQMVATQAAAATSILPAALLSGLVIPVENMPAILRVVTQILPVQHFVRILRGIMLRGASWDMMAADGAVLALFAVAMLAASTAAFRKEVA